MTTIPVPDPAEPVTLTRVVNDEPVTLTARDAKGIQSLIDWTNRNAVVKPFLQKARGSEGVGSLGLYIEAVSFLADGAPFTHMKFFVVANNVYAYNRTSGDARANWRRRAMSSPVDALTTVQAVLDRPNVKVFGHPVLVELQSDDLSAIEEGGMPPARFRGESRIQRDFGRYNFETEVVTAPLPAGLVRALRS